MLIHQSISPSGCPVSLISLTFRFFRIGPRSFIKSRSCTIISFSNRRSSIRPTPRSQGSWTTKPIFHWRYRIMTSFLRRLCFLLTVTDAELDVNFVWVPALMLLRRFQYGYISKLITQKSFLPSIPSESLIVRTASSLWGPRLRSGRSIFSFAVLK